jgi:hypothetical protein
MPATRWLSSRTQAIAAFDKPAEPCSLPLEVSPSRWASQEKKLGLCWHSAWLLNTILTQAFEHTIWTIVANWKVSRLKRSLPSTLRA